MLGGNCTGEIFLGGQIVGGIYLGIIFLRAILIGGGSQVSRRQFSYNRLNENMIKKRVSDEVQAREEKLEKHFFNSNSINRYKRNSS